MKINEVKFPPDAKKRKKAPPGERASEQGRILVETPHNRIGFRVRVRVRVT